MTHLDRLTAHALKVYQASLIEIAKAAELLEQIEKELTKSGLDFITPIGGSRWFLVQLNKDQDFSALLPVLEALAIEPRAIDYPENLNRDFDFGLSRICVYADRDTTKCRAVLKSSEIIPESEVKVYELVCSGDAK